jgi:hypothetical protein
LHSPLTELKRHHQEDNGSELMQAVHRLFDLALERPEDAGGAQADVELAPVEGGKRRPS